MSSQARPDLVVETLQYLEKKLLSKRAVATYKRNYFKVRYFYRSLVLTSIAIENKKLVECFPWNPFCNLKEILAK